MSKILVIDDEETNVRVLSMSLRSDDHEVVTAYSGEEGLEVFKKEVPEIVLTDIKMPGMNGIEVLQKIKEIDSEPEVIIITGHGDIDNAIEALKYGASDFINKPIRDEVLAIALKRAEEKLHIKRELKKYTRNLENKVEETATELRRSSNFLRKLIRSSNEGIIATDKDQRIVIFNPGAERILGFSRDEVVEKMTTRDLLSDDMIGRFIENGDSGRIPGELPWQETMVSSKTGENIPVKYVGTYLYEKKKIMGSVAFFQDLREIKRLEAELVGSERLAAIGQTIAGMAHGVKNILHGFKGGSYLVDIGIKRDDKEKLQKGWKMIQRNIGRTSDLVMDLLSYSKEREPEYDICQPNEIAGEVCELLDPVAVENRVELVREFDESIKSVMIDPNTIHRALMNLMSNAIDACLFDEDTSKHFQVRLKTARDEDGRIRFEVTDNGAGMSQEVQEKLFTSFFSTKGHRGTGLGLLVTRKLIEEHGGEIQVHSKITQGTTFVMILPIAES